MFTLPRMMLSLAVASSSAGGGCGEILFAEVETEQVCKTLEPTELPANPSGLHLTHRVVGEVDLGEELPLEDAIDGDIQLESLTLQLPTSGPTADFIEAAHVDVAPSASPGAGTRVLDYARGAAVGHTLEVASSQALNLLELSRQGPVQLTIGLSGVSPAEAWTVTPRVCFSARVKVDYAQLGK